MKLGGLYTAMATPFNEKGRLDEEGLRRNARHQMQHDVAGVLVLGSTGESPTLNPIEKRRILEIVIEEVKGKAVVMAGTGSYSTEQAIAATREAGEMGADLALVVVPYYNKPTQEGLYRHFATLCEATSIPICIYNIPSRTGCTIHPETVQRLASFPALVGLKESGAPITRIHEWIQQAASRPAPFALLAGDDDMTLPLMASGGQGVISVASNVVPGPMRCLVQAAASGDFVLARQWHDRLFPLFKALSIETNPIPIKTAMSLYGMPSGPCRLPLCELSPEHVPSLRQLLIELADTNSELPLLR